MALASLNPYGSSLSSYLNSRQALNKQVSSRPHLSKSDMSALRDYSLGDSSDEEIPVPTFKCSALTSALLNDVSVSPDSHISKQKKISPEPEQNQISNTKEGNIDFRIERQRYSPNKAREKNGFPRRKVRLSRVPDTSLFCRPKSLPQVDFDQNAAHSNQNDSLNLSTPAPAARRVVRIPASYGSNVHSASSPSSNSCRRNSSSPREEKEIEALEYPVTVSRTNQPVSQGSVSKYGQSTIGRVRYADEAGVKKIAGAFMSVRPRRGRRHISDEGQSPVEENFGPSTHDDEIQMSQSHNSLGRGSASSQEGQQIFEPLYQKSNFSSGSPMGSNVGVDSFFRSKSLIIPNSRPDLSESKDPRESNQNMQPSAPTSGILLQQPSLPSKYDQENELIASLECSKQASSVHPVNVDKIMAPSREEDAPIQDKILSDRPPLALKSQNTPRRLAPPPPKMSLLEAATSTAGATTTSNASGKRNRMKINGKIFARLDCIGRGGSSRVYRVMAENSKFFALKKVSLEEADENAIKGFKGEIDLLKKLENVERVIRLYDYELNENKGTLSVVSNSSLDFCSLLTRNKNSSWS